MIEKTLEILKHKKDAFLNNIAKFNKKAAKLGTMPMVVEWGSDKIRSFYASPEAEVWGVLTKVFLQTVTVKYDIPKIDGWDLVCIFDYETYTDEHGNDLKAVFTNAVPDKVVPERYQNKTEIHCEHCGHNRYRVKSYLVVNEEGEYKEVGSTCLKDFLGHDPANFIWFASIEDKLRNCEEEFGYGSFGSADPIAYDLLGILTLTNAMITLNGWTSRGEAYENPSLTATADYVLDYLYKPNKLDSEIINPSDEDKNIAERTLEHFRNLPNEDNDYINNCKKVVTLNAVPDRRMGIACSMIQVYKRHMEKELERANELPSDWFGNIGSRLEDCQVTCTFKTHCETMYGVSTLYKFMDLEGNVFKTFYSGHTWSVEQGEKTRLWGTVKKHDEWNGKKETMLSRCNIKDIDPLDNFLSKEEVTV
jgi:hypothetical protein